MFKILHLLNNCYIQDMKRIAEKLIQLNSKIWLAEKIGISRVTLDTRLEKDNWKRSEIALLLQLDKQLVKA